MVQISRVQESAVIYQATRRAPTPLHMTTATLSSRFASEGKYYLVLITNATHIIYRISQTLSYPFAMLIRNKNILRKTTEGYLNSFDFITF